MFVKTDHTLWATGSNNSGQLGSGNYNSTIAPVPVAKAVTSLAVGDTHGLYGDMIPLIGSQPADAGVPADGAATLTVAPLGEPPFTYQWYLGTAGSTGQPIADATAATFTTPNLTSNATYWVRVTNAHGSVDSRSVSVQIVTPPQITSISEPQTIVTGRSVTLLVTAAGGVLSYQWYEGLAGDTAKPVTGANGPQLLSPPLAANTAYWVRVANAAGSADSGTLPVTVTPRLATRLMACGLNSSGQLGDGTTADRGVPVRIAADAVEMDAGNEHSMYFKADGSLWACGSNGSGRLGDGTTIGRPAPVPVAAAVRACAAGGSHSLYVSAAGGLWATGANFNGQLGDGTTIARNSPVQVATAVLGVAAGGGHSMFLTTDSNLWTMGSNSSGQLGDGTFTNRSSPTPVATAVAAVAAGGAHSLFIKTDGSLWAVGSNGSGRLGDGTTTTRLTPVNVAANVTAVAAGSSHSLFLKTDGTLWAMGANSSGQLGDGTTTSRATPVQVASGVIDVAAGSNHSMFLKSDATLWAMGSNTSGQLGDGTTVNRIAPVQVASAVASLALGASHSLYRDLLPSIGAEPPDGVARSGGSATLSVAPGGAGPFTFQWYVGQSGDLSQPVPEATAASFTTPSLTADTSYWVRVANAHGTADSRTVTVTVITMSPEYQTWANASGLTAATFAPAADPDHDGLANLVEFALATDPLQPTAQGRPAGGVIREGGRDLLFVTHRRLKDSGLVLTYQKSDDLGEWTDFVAEIAVLDTDLDGDGRTELVRASRPLGAGETSGFLRLWIVMP
jgi:alpha-tubulin suppressor-like RCC1 family protein